MGVLQVDGATSAVMQTLPHHRGEERAELKDVLDLPVNLWARASS